jgi:hypothetical protein
MTIQQCIAARKKTCKDLRYHRQKSKSADVRARKLQAKVQRAKDMALRKGNKKK